MALRTHQRVRIETEALRRVLLIANAAPLLPVATILFVLGAPSLWFRIVLPAVLVYHGGLLLLLATRRLDVDLAGMLVYWSPVVVVLARLALWATGVMPDSGEPSDMIAMSLWVFAIYPLAFVVFGTRRGLHASLTFSFALVALLGPHLVGQLRAGTLDADTAAFLYLLAISAALLGLLWLLASRFEALADERARADVLAELATTDQLTGIPNRRRLEGELDRLVARSRRYGHPFSVVLVDLDEFKGVNDRFGHEVGDRVLVSAAARIGEAVRSADLVGRWGGEEFLLLAPQTGHDDALALAERCRAAIVGAPMEVCGRPVTASLGVASLEGDEEARSLLRRADVALYTAKNAGRDRVVGMRSSRSPSGTDPTELAS